MGRVLGERMMAKTSENEEGYPSRDANLEEGNSRHVPRVILRRQEIERNGIVDLIEREGKGCDCECLGL